MVLGTLSLLYDVPNTKNSYFQCRAQCQKKLIPNSVIAANDPEINNSYRRAQKFIKNFSSQIFELFQAFHKCKDSSDLPLLNCNIVALRINA